MEVRVLSYCVVYSCRGHHVGSSMAVLGSLRLLCVSGRILCACCVCVCVDGPTLYRDGGVEALEVLGLQLVVVW